MDRRDWLIPLLAAVVGVMGTLGGSLVAGYQHERAVARQAQRDLAKQQAAACAEELNAIKHTGLRYMAATDALVNQLVFVNTRDKVLIDHLALVQSASNELVLMADDELTRQTLALNQALARLLMPQPQPQPMAQRLAELNLEVVDWIKQFKRSLDALKTRNEEALGVNASVQVVTALKR